MQGAHPETRTASGEAPLQSLEGEDGKECTCLLRQVWHKGNERRRFAFREDKVALTHDFNIATYSELLNSKLHFF